MGILEFIYGIIVLIAIFITVIGLAGLHYDFKAKEDKIENLERQLYELRKKNMEKARKEREAKKNNKKRGAK